MSRIAMDYSTIDSQIISMRQERRTVQEIADALGISERTVSKRIREKKISKPYVVRKKPAFTVVTKGRYRPSHDERMTLAALLTTASAVKRKTGARSERVIAAVLDLASRGKLDIKRVAL